LRYQTSLHHRQGATDHAVGARAHTRSRATPTRRASGEDAPAAGDRRTPLRYAKDEDGGDALPDEDAAAGRLRDGAARIGLQSHSRHEHHWHSAAHDGNQGLVKAGNGSHCRFAKMRSFRKSVLTQPRPNSDIELALMSACTKSVGALSEHRPEPIRWCLPS
jgi:hypothetical protein